jgi:putative DNA methylase
MTDTLSSVERAVPSSTPYRTKLIEVALPLQAINAASAREKSIRHGHPSTLHLWWARRPLAACRAVLFAQLVDDPSAVPEEFPTEEAQEAERQRLFRIIENLVPWENSTKEECLMPARREIARSVARSAGVAAPETDADVWRILREHAPPVLDPFCGGGSIPLEAQRLGLEAHASDLNPVAVLITKALIEIPPKFAGMPPVNPRDRDRGMGASWKGAAGLAADVRYYGEWMREEAFKRIGHLYPKAKLPGGGEATVIAWLWARTVKCPNPACGAQMPLVRSFALSTKKGKETWLEPVVDRTHNPPDVTFRVARGQVPSAKWTSIGVGSGLSNDKGKKAQATFQCIACHSGIAKGDYVDSEADDGRMGVMPLAVVAEGQRSRSYLGFDALRDREALVDADEFVVRPEVADHLPLQQARGTFASNAQGRMYGFKTFADYFTRRQLVTLSVFSDLVDKARDQAQRDAVAAGLSTDGDSQERQGSEAGSYANAVAMYLAFVIDKLADRSSTICTWDSSPKMEALRNTFARQAIPMTWDFAEGNPFSESSGNWIFCVDWVADAVRSAPARREARVIQADAAGETAPGWGVASTDPPYYDNIGYADLSDFFYVWLRRSLRSIYPTLFNTVLTPKGQELVATAHRFGGSKQDAEKFFREGLEATFIRLHEAEDRRFPMTVYYAFKQVESGGDEPGIASTGWETMLTGLLRAGFAVSGTWPMRSELSNRMVASGTNALASSIVLVCRPRPEDANIATRREFIAALRGELPAALKLLTHASVAAVDLAQAAIGPGMRVFSRYAKVLESNGEPMTVRAALGLINQVLYEVEAEAESEDDADTRWAITWFEQYGMNEGPFGDAETLSKAKDTSVGGLVAAGIVEARGGKVRLRRRDELPADWDPLTDRRLTVWEVTQHLIRALDTGGEVAAADLLRKVGGLGESARDLAYALYLVADRKKWTEEGIAYNSLAVSWPEISRLAAGMGPAQAGLELG